MVVPGKLPGTIVGVLPAAAVKAQVAERAALLVPHRGETTDEAVLPADYRRILAIVRSAGGPVRVRTVGEELGLEVGLVYTARLTLSSATLNWLADLLRRRLKMIGSRWRALPAGKVAASCWRCWAVTSGPAIWPAATRRTAPP